MRLRARLAALATTVIVLSTVIALPAQAADSTTASALPGLLRQSPETTTPQYSRDRFEHWVDADGDGCNTRYEVLIEESAAAVAVGAGCTIEGGSWVSPYDGVAASSPSQIEIDHVVALAEAWRSGAWSWTDEQRRAFANDTDVPYALVAASSASNQAKSDKDPAEWLPANDAYLCEYVIGWTLTKYRWSLAVDAAELAVLESELSGACGSTVVELPLVMMAAPSPETPTANEPRIDAGLNRIYGSSRYDTAIAAAQRYSPGVPAVFVATGADFPDALSGAAAAAHLGGPLLLTPSAQIPAGVLAEIDRLRPDVIYAIGGTGAISARAFSQLAAVAPSERLGAQNRYDTGLAIVDSAFTSASTAFIATGRSYPDALAATGAAGLVGAPIVLLDGMSASVPPATLRALDRLGVKSVNVVGGTGAVSSGIENALRRSGYNVTRYSGSDRYSTASAVNGAFFAPGDSETVFLATGTNFPDALAGAALAGRVKAPLYITAQACVPASIRDSIAGIGASNTVVMGGPSVVSDAAASNLGCLSSAVPAISGTAKAGSTLTASPGTWTAGTQFSYQWYANGAPLGGGATLALTSSHVGKRITVRVTGALAGFVGVARTSPATVAVAAATVRPPAPPAPQPPRYPNAVTPGAFCAKEYAGWTAYSTRGALMVCKTTPADSRLRWRAA